ncbi:MAG TPA: hypothetical protein VGK81_03510, partial [Anaerolineae bacterium]
MLTDDDLKKLITAGPGPRIDILTPGAATIERMSRSLVSLANAQGGVLLVPFNTGKGRTSIDPNDLLDLAGQAALRSEPHLIIPLPYLLCNAPHESPTALVVEVPDGLPHAYSLDGRYHSRNGARVVTLTARALHELLLQRSDGSWEAQTPNGSSREDLDWSKVESYAAQASSVGESTVEELLLRRGCIVRQGKRIKPTYAGLLLFGKQPQRWVRGAEVLAVRFKGPSMDDVFTRQTISHTLSEQIRRAELFISENVSQHARIGAW